ncbi:MAG: peptidoglycan editing factor PgeF [Yoonia sp.]
MSLDIITDDLLDGVTHGFFGRKGGVSSGVFAGLNCGFGSTDQHDIVATNRARVAQAMGGSADDMVGVHQCHSADVVSVNAPIADKPKADGLVTATRGITLSVLTADCQPVLFADKDAGVIGAAHAGWQGALHGVMDNTITKMVALGAARDNIVAVIGPSISQRAYEVGPEFAEQFIDEDAANARFFANGNGDRMLFDLTGFGLARLRAAGIKDANWTRHCTYGDPDRFYSYRRSVHQKEADYGRQIAAIRL